MRDNQHATICFPWHRNLRSDAERCPRSLATDPVAGGDDDRMSDRQSARSPNVDEGRKHGGGNDFHIRSVFPVQFQGSLDRPQRDNSGQQLTPHSYTQSTPAAGQSRDLNRTIDNNTNLCQSNLNG